MDETNSTDEPQLWYFTFGLGQKWQNRYITFFGTFQEARWKMFEKFGSAWCGQYRTAQDAGLHLWNYVELTVEEVDADALL